MAVYFFDSSALVKRYAHETGSAWVLAITEPAAGHAFSILPGSPQWKWYPPWRVVSEAAQLPKLMLQPR